MPQHTGVRIAIAIPARIGTPVPVGPSVETQRIRQRSTLLQDAFASSHLWGRALDYGMTCAEVYHGPRQHLSSPIAEAFWVAYLRHHNRIP